MSDVLIVSGHTDLEDSVANTAILAELARLLPQARVERLDTLYPDYRIDVAAEQARLEAADIVVLQFPLFWYSMPSILERWMEQTFQHGWSHGSTGDRLRGKKLVVSVTAGAPAEMYTSEGAMGHTVEEFLAATVATAALTGMEHAGFVVTNGVSFTLRSAEGNAIIREKAADHARRVADLVAHLDRGA